MTIMDEVSSAIDDLINKKSCEINIEFCEINGENMKQISKYLEINDIVRSFTLSHCNIDFEIESFANALFVNKTLKTLDLSGCNISSTNMEYISHALKSNTKLQTLNLNGNKLSMNAAHDLSFMILNNTNLNSLFLNNCFNKMKNSIPIINILDESTIINLQLGHNASGINMKKLISVVSQMQFIQSLSLEKNNINNNDLLMLSDFFANTTKLRDLNLNCNKINSDGVKIIANIISKNKSLAKITLCKCRLTHKSR